MYTDLSPLVQHVRLMLTTDPEQQQSVTLWYWYNSTYSTNSIHVSLFCKENCTFLPSVLGAEESPGSRTEQRDPVCPSSGPLGLAAGCGKVWDAL